MKEFKYILREYIDQHAGGKPYLLSQYSQQVNQSSIYNWVSGKREPNLQKLIQLSHYLSEVSDIPYQDIIIELVLSLPASIEIIKGQEIKKI